MSVYKTFLNLISSRFFKQDDKHWIAPLTFKSNKPSLENIIQIAKRRSKSFYTNLRCNSAHTCVRLQAGTRNPWKPESIRVVLNPSANYRGLSFNDVFLKRPDICNNFWNSTPFNEKGLRRYC